MYYLYHRSLGGFLTASSTVRSDLASAKEFSEKDAEKICKNYLSGKSSSRLPNFGVLPVNVDLLKKIAGAPDGK